MITELTCINCPLGCSLTATVEDGAVTSVTGNTCKRGEVYAKTEVVSPVRTVTSTVKVLGGERPVVSVKTKGTVPKSSINDCMEVIRRAKAIAPVKIGDVILTDIAGTGVELVAAANCEKI